MPAAVAITALLAVMAVFQVALAAGAPLGHFAWGGQHRILPTRLRIGSAVTVPIYAVIALLAFDRVGAIDIVPEPVAVVGMWVVVGFLALSIGMNAISRSRPERFTMVPVSIVLAALSLRIALG